MVADPAAWRLWQHGPIPPIKTPAEKLIRWYDQPISKGRVEIRGEKINGVMRGELTRRAKVRH
jgi:hypothetical protein